MNREGKTAVGPDDQAELLALARAGCADARDRLVRMHAGLVWKAVRRMARYGEDVDDLYQIGCLGLLKAIVKFDPAYGVQFSTYAVPLIIGELRRHFRDQGQLKVSRSLKELAARVARARAALGAGGSEPAVGALAAAVGADVAEVVAALEATRPVAYLDEQVSGDDADPVVLSDRVAGEGGDDARWVDRLAVRQGLAALDPRLRRLLWWRFFCDQTQAEVAERLGLSQAQVSRLERQALTALRQHLRS